MKIRIIVAFKFLLVNFGTFICIQEYKIKELKELNVPDIVNIKFSCCNGIGFNFEVEILNRLTGQIKKAHLGFSVLNPLTYIVDEIIHFQKTSDSTTFKS